MCSLIRVLRVGVALFVASLVSLLLPFGALAHDDRSTAPETIWAAWSLEPWTVFGIGIAAVWYWAGARQLRRQAAGRVAFPTWRVAAYYTGLGTLFLALASPLHFLGERLISAHMVQHMVMTMVAAPLILLGDPLLAMLWALPARRRRAVGLQLTPGLIPHRVSSWLFRPLIALVLHVLTVVLWHLPPFYQAAVHFEWVHYLQHVTFFGTALLYWWPVVETAPARRVMPAPLKLLHIFFAMLFQTKLIGGVLTFVTGPIYVHYVETAPLWGISALEDQRLAGIAMLVGGFMMYMMIFTAAFFIWAYRAEQQERRRYTS